MTVEYHEPNKCPEPRRKTAASLAAIVGGPLASVTLFFAPLYDFYVREGSYSDWYYKPDIPAPDFYCVLMGLFMIIASLYVINIFCEQDHWELSKAGNGTLIIYGLMAVAAFFAAHRTQLPTTIVPAAGLLLVPFAFKYAEAPKELREEFAKVLEVHKAKVREERAQRHAFWEAESARREAEYEREKQLEELRKMEPVERMKAKLLAEELMRARAAYLVECKYCSSVYDIFAGECPKCGATNPMKIVQPEGKPALISDLTADAEVSR